MSIAAERYAKALLNLAIQDHDIAGYQDSLAAVSRIMEEQKELDAFLLSPRRDPAVKKSLLVRVFGGAAGKNILSLLLLLLEKGRIRLLPDICSAYVEMADAYRKILSITVTTALPLDRAQIDSIGEKFRAAYHASSIKITVKTDGSLVGGVKVAVGDRLYDGTVKGKLSKMQSALAGP